MVHVLSIAAICDNHYMNLFIYPLIGVTRSKYNVASRDKVFMIDLESDILETCFSSTVEGLTKDEARQIRFISFNILPWNY